MDMFKSVIAVTFQSIFYTKIHQIDFFIFYKLFLRLAHQNDPKHIKKLFFSKTKIIFFGNAGTTAFPNALSCLGLQLRLRYKILFA
jgi:hypothetical protein